LINRKVAARNGTLHRLLAKGLSNAQLIEQLYLATLGRTASPKEKAYWIKQIPPDADSGPDSPADSSKRTQAFEDLFWALLSSRPFKTNH